MHLLQCITFTIGGSAIIHNTQKQCKSFCVQANDTIHVSHIALRKHVNDGNHTSKVERRWWHNNPFVMGSERRSIGRHVRTFDAFARSKVPDDLRHQTTLGGSISLASYVVMFILFCTELNSFLTLKRTTNLSVDDSKSTTLKVHIDIDFPYINCEVLGIDAADVSGNTQLEITNHMYKTPINHRGIRVGTRTRLKRHVRMATSPSPSPWPNGCASCMGAGAPGMCCNTCDDVRKAYEKEGWMLTDLSRVPQCVREGRVSLQKDKFDPEHGCNIHGYVQVLKVAGTLRITPGHTFSFMGAPVHDLSVMRNHDINLSHRFRKLSFGDAFPGQTNPLDGVVKRVSGKRQHIGQHEYFLKVVPTTYRKTWGRILNTNQYSVTQYFRANQGLTMHLPGIFLFYDMSPIKVEVVESRRSFFHFLVQLCAIIGGVFTVSSLISTFMDDVVLRAVRKREVGKLI